VFTIVKYIRVISVTLNLMEDEKMIVLVHGFYRNKTDMSYLETQLNSLGYETFVANLPTTFGTLKEMVDALALQLESLKEQEISFVAHSMGGLIVREYINAHNELKIKKCIFIATPHHGSQLADIAMSIPLFASVFKPIEELKTTNKYKAFRDKTFDLGLIAGENNKDILGRFFMPKQSDGKVSIDSVKTDDADDFVVLPFEHDNIHKKKETLKQVVSFLETSKFKEKTL